jgi:hypothetical protein
MSGGEVKRSCSTRKRKGRSELGLNPRHSALIPPNGDTTGPGRLGLSGHGPAGTCHRAFEALRH